MSLLAKNFQLVRSAAKFFLLATLAQTLLVAVDQCKPKTARRLDKCTKLLDRARQDVMKDVGSASCIALLPEVALPGA